MGAIPGKIPSVDDELAIRSTIGRRLSADCLDCHAISGSRLEEFMVGQPFDRLVADITTPLLYGPGALDRVRRTLRKVALPVSRMAKNTHLSASQARRRPRTGK